MPKTDSEAILILDEDPLARRLASSILRVHKYRVVEATEWKRVQPMLRKSGVRVAIIDFRMEKESRSSLVDRLRKYSAGVHVILAYRPEDEETVRSAAETPGTTYLPKPFTPAELFRAVRSATERRTRRALSNVA